MRLTSTISLGLFITSLYVTLTSCADGDSFVFRGEITFDIAGAATSERPGDNDVTSREDGMTSRGDGMTSREDGTTSRSGGGGKEVTGTGITSMRVRQLNTSTH